MISVKLIREYFLFSRDRILAMIAPIFLIFCPHSVAQQPAATQTGPPQPIQYVQPKPSHSHESQGLPTELLAILQSIFGMGASGSGGRSSSCAGVREIACPSDDGGPETYSPDSFGNARPTATSDLTTPFKILGPFKKYFDSCTGKAGLGSCKFVNLGIKGDASHRARRSCHNSAQAIDVGPLTCSSGRRVLASDPLYFEVAKCMANDTGDELQVIFYKKEGQNMIQKSDHNNHMHIQIKRCSMVYG